MYIMLMMKRNEHQPNGCVLLPNAVGLMKGDLKLNFVIAI